MLEEQENLDSARILVVEDHPAIRDSLENCLRDEGYIVDSAASGDIGLSKAISYPYDVLILDLLLPNIDGLEILRRFRAEFETPVLILTARDDLELKIQGLDSGANDYITKPFQIEELKARVRVMLRDKERRLNGSKTLLGNIEIDSLRRQVKQDGEMIEFSAKEFFVLEYLALNKGTIISRQKLFQLFFSDTESSQSNVLDVYIGTLRKKLGKELITTHKGKGYCIH